MFDTTCCLKEQTTSTVLWKIIDTCNVQCLHCFSYRGPNKIEKWKDQVARIHKSAISRVVITGGEPLLHPDLVEIVRQLKSRCKVTVITNGLLLKTAMAKALKQVGLDSIDISLQSHDHKIQDRISNLNGAHQKIVSAMNICRNIGVPFSCSITILPSNENSIGELIDFVFSLGAKSISINSLLPPKHADTELMLWLATWNAKHVRTIICQKRQEYGTEKIKTSRVYPPSGVFQCPANKSFWGITSDGQWFPCLLAMEMQKYISPRWDYVSKPLDDYPNIPILSPNNCPILEVE